MTTPSCERPEEDRPGHLDDKTRALVCLGALIAAAGEGDSYRHHVASAIGAGATHDEIVDVLTSVARSVGLAHLVSAAGPLAHELGVDVDRAFEQLDRTIE